MTKGLDLQGGLEVVLKAQPPKGHKLQKSDLDRSVSIMRNRVDKLGVASPEIREQQPDEIVIQLAGVHDPAQAAAIIGKTAQLELYDLTPALEPPSIDATGNNVDAVHEPLRAADGVQSRAKAGTPSRLRALQAGQGDEDNRHRQEEEDDDVDRRSAREERRPDRDAAPRPDDRQPGPARLATAARSRPAGRC